MFYLIERVPEIPAAPQVRERAMREIAVVLKIEPRSYIHWHNCTHDIAEHHNTVLQAITNSRRLRDLKKTLRRRHGRAVKIRHHRRWRRQTHLTLVYSQQHFPTSDEVYPLIEWLKNQLYKRRVTPKVALQC